MDWSRFEILVAPARRSPALWRLVCAVFLILTIQLLWVAAFLGALWLVTLRSDFVAYRISRLFPADTPSDVLLLLLTFLGMAFGAILSARWLHGRDLPSLIGPASRTLRDFASAAVIAGSVLGLSLFAWTFSYEAMPNISFGMWAAWLPMALAALLIQTGTEELVFRGYFQSQLAARFRSPLVWLLGPAILLGLIHYDPTAYGGNAWLAVVAATLFGVLAADLTAHTGSIGAAWGFHFANNCISVLLISSDGAISGLALYLTPYGADELPPSVWLGISDLFLVLLCWILIRRVVRA